MKLNHFIGSFGFEQDQLQITDRDLVHQWFTVLRLQIGERVVLCDGRGSEVVGEIVRLDKHDAAVRILERRKSIDEPVRHVTLYCAIVKRELFELIVQKATEVGASEIVPMVTRRTIKQNVKMERLRQIAKEAAEQSGRGVVPVVHEPMPFKDACKHASENDRVFFFDVGANGIRPPQTDPRTDKTDSTDGSKIGLMIGPEGGWDPDEVRQAKDAGFTSATLGAFTLRAETAAIVATYLAVNGG